MGRQERRRNERDVKKGIRMPYSDPLIKNAVVHAVERQIANKDGYNRGLRVALLPMTQAIYAAAIMVLHDDYGWEKDQMIEFLEKIEDKTALALDNQEIIQEALDRTGIKIKLAEGVDRIGG